MTDITPQGLAARDDMKALADVYWKLRSYAVHDDNCTINRHPHYRGCSCGLTAALVKGEAASNRILAALEATPEALADLPAVRALVEAAEARGMDRAADFVGGEASSSPDNVAWCVEDLATAIRAEAAAIRQGETT